MKMKVPLALPRSLPHPLDAQIEPGLPAVMIDGDPFELPPGIAPLGIATAEDVPTIGVSTSIPFDPYVELTKHQLAVIFPPGALDYLASQRKK